MNLARITPSGAVDHHGLRADFKEFVEGRGFVFQDSGVEERCDQHKLKILSRIQDSTSLYIRGAPDAWIAHEKHGAIQIEFKSRQRDYQNMALEAQPFASAITRARPPLNIRVLYCYRDPVINQDAGFWCSTPPQINRLLLGPKDAEIHGYVKRVFPGIEYESFSSNNGSGDSFVLINQPVWTQLRDWRELITELIFGF